MRSGLLRPTAVLAFALAAAATAGAQEPAEGTPGERPPRPTGRPVAVFVHPGEVVVTPTLTPRDPFSLPTAVTVVTGVEIAERSPLSVVDALDERVGIWVEKRTTSTSDPVIRGLSGSNLLALVDGNTLSTFWGEGGYAGDDMYGKVDAESVARVEVVRGPRSVLYGSNALGGVLNFITRSCPLDFPAEGSRWGTEIRPSAASAAGEARYRQELFAATPGFRFILGGSLRRVDDVRPGGGGLQVPTGAREANWDLKAEWRLAAGDLTLTAQDVNRDRVHRFYRPDQSNDNDREAVAVEYRHRRPARAWDEAVAGLYFQDKLDRRFFHTRGWRGEAHTRTWSARARADKALGRHALTYGLSYELDLGESADDEQLTLHYPDGRVEKAAPDTRWQGLGVFLQDEWAVSAPFRLTWALRADAFRFASAPDALYHPPGGWDPARDELDERETSLVGSLGALYEVSDRVHLAASWGRGYRLWAPQFGVTQRGYGVVVPSGLLDPVTGDTWEVGVKQRSASWRLEAFLYHSRFRNWQTTVPSTFAGQDWYDYDGDGVRGGSERVYVTRSVGDAWVEGVELEGAFDLPAAEPLGPGWSVGGGYARNRGRMTTLDEPLRHTQPEQLLLFVEWRRPDLARAPYLRLGATFVDRYDQVSADRLRDDPGYRVDPQDPSSPLLRPYGLPGYSVYSLRGGLSLAAWADLHLAVDNLLDRRYRRAHSRWDEPGFNLTVALRVRL